MQRAGGGARNKARCTRARWCGSHRGPAHRRSRGGRPRQHSPTQLVHGLARVGVNHGTVVVDSSVSHAGATKVLLVPLNVLRIPGAVQDGADPWRSAKHGREQGGQRSHGPGGCTEAPNAPARSFRAAACGSCPRGPCPGTALLRAPPAGPAGAPCRPRPTSAEKYRSALAGPKGGTKNASAICWKSLAQKAASGMKGTWNANTYLRQQRGVVWCGVCSARMGVGGGVGRG